MKQRNVKFDEHVLSFLGSGIQIIRHIDGKRVDLEREGLERVGEDLRQVLEGLDLFGGKADPIEKVDSEKIGEDLHQATPSSGTLGEKVNTDMDTDTDVKTQSVPPGLDKPESPLLNAADLDIIHQVLTQHSLLSEDEWIRMVGDLIIYRNLHLEHPYHTK